MENNYIKEQQFLNAKKRVKSIKEFYSHLVTYIIINIFISCVILYGLTRSEFEFSEAIFHIGVYMTWIFWGIGLFFHWLGVFGFNSFFGKSWEEKKLKELMQNEDNKIDNFFKNK